ncbi:MAG: Na+/H+ antiporter NhaA [Myxococcales bacterium]|nr:Na+/H+ antiporter NhaA [Myxococcales bacterium]
MAPGGSSGSELRLLDDIDPERDHIRGAGKDDAVAVVGYQDFLCPYCRRLRPVFRRLRDALGDRLVYAFRHFPNDRAHPGAELAARAAEAAARQGAFFEMHDALFDHEPPIRRAELLELARGIGLDVDRFARDLDGPETRARVEEDVARGRANGVTGTPTLFVDGVRYDGAWDYHSMLEAFERPVAARVRRSARVFASLPTSAGLVLVLTAALAMVCANTPLGPLYERVMNANLVLGPAGHPLALTTRGWLSEGLLSLFFLIVGLEIRREMTVGALASWRNALLPVIAAAGGVVTPALIYLAMARGPAARGWAIPTATDVAFALGLLALLGDRIPVGLRVFVAALAVVDDFFSVLTLAIFFPSAFTPIYALPVAGCVLLLVAFNRARVYATWPYVLASLALWLSLHELGVHAALTGAVLAMCLPTRPAPSPAPLLAQAANALAALDDAERAARREGRSEARLEGAPVWAWAARNLWAATERLLSPAERIERAVAPWSAYVILPVFAFSVTGVSLAIHLSAPASRHVFVGTIVGLLVGKPLGILAASWAGAAARVAAFPEGVTARQLVGAACLCGVGDTMALLMADRAFSPEEAAVAKMGVLVGSILAGVTGVAILRRPASASTPVTDGSAGTPRRQVARSGS